MLGLPYPVILRGATNGLWVAAGVGMDDRLVGPTAWLCMRPATHRSASILQSKMPFLEAQAHGAGRLAPGKPTHPR